MNNQYAESNLKRDGELIGCWQNGQEVLQINEDGTLNYRGQTYLYSAQNNVLTLIPLSNASQTPYQQTGNILKLLVNGQEVTFARQTKSDRSRMGTERTDDRTLGNFALRSGNSNPITSAIAGVWVGEETSLDPSYYMSYTRYLMLYPDGSVGFDKAEGGASYNKLSECFSYFSVSPAQNRNIWGRWETDGINILIYWRNNTVWQGQVDLNSGRMMMFGVGAIDAGSNVMFERKM